jgi:hypothetical protein
MGCKTAARGTNSKGDAKRAKGRGGGGKGAGSSTQAAGTGKGSGNGAKKPVNNLAMMAKQTELNKQLFKSLELLHKKVLAGSTPKASGKY